MKKYPLVFIVLTILLFFANVNNAQVTVTLPNAIGTPGSTSLANVQVNNLSGLGVVSFRFQVNYNPNIIYITGYDVSNSIASSTTHTATIDTLNGFIRIAAFTGSSLAGSGTLLKLRIKYRNVGTTALNFDNAIQVQFQTFSGDLTVTKNNGTATVSTTNNPPIFTNVPSQTVNENQLLTFNVVATDPESLPVTITHSTLPQGANFNTQTGAFTWTPNFDQQGNYSITFTASDGNSNATMTVQITVVNVNRVPTLNLNQGGPFNINENQSLVIQLTGADSDQNAVLTYTFSGIQSGATLTKNSNTSATFNWTPGPTQSGNYTVIFTVTDELNATDSKTVQITVNDVSSAPTLTLSPPSPYTINEGQILDIQLVGSDPDAGSVLKYSAQGMPSGATLGENTGLFSWTPQFTQSGSHSIVFKVTDETQLFDTKTASITVVNVNRAPVFLTIMAPRTVTVHNVPVEFTFQYSGIDPDNDQTFFLLPKGPLGSSITPNGLFKWAPYSNQAGQQFQVIVELTDGTASVKDTTTLTGSALVGVEEVGGVPTKYSLEQNFPNPFNPTTTINYILPEESFVTIKIFSMLGQEIATLVSEYKSAGYYKVDFNANNLQSGIYFYQMKANNYSSIKKMILVK